MKGFFKNCSFRFYSIMNLISVATFFFFINEADETTEVFTFSCERGKKKLGSLGFLNRFPEMLDSSNFLVILLSNCSMLPAVGSKLFLLPVVQTMEMSWILCYSFFKVNGHMLTF